MSRRTLVLKSGRILPSVDLTRRLPSREDRERWPPGPWDDEPDKVVWVDEVTDLDCMVVRNHLGAYCGYVGLPPGHPWHGFDYGQCLNDCGQPWCSNSLDSNLLIHGDLTYAASCQEGGDVCHVARRGRPDDVWWLGFDCAHGGDYIPGLELSHSMVYGNFPGEVYRDLDYVVEQVEFLAVQCVR